MNNADAMNQDAAREIPCVQLEAKIVPALEKPKMGEYRRHLVLCVGPRCAPDGAAQSLFDSLGERFKAAGLDKGDLRVKRTRASCFATCKSGPVMCVQPDGIWYYNVTPANMDRIIQQHLLQGEPVEDLIYHRGPVQG